MGQRQMSEQQKSKCNGIIHTASVAAAAAASGLAQIPLADTAIITPIQITMLTSLSQVFDLRISEGATKSILAGLTASYVGRAAAQILVGWIPFIGNTINSATAFALTETIGWKAAEHFFGIYCDDLDKKADAFDKAAAAYKNRINEFEKMAKEIAWKFEEFEKKKNCQIEKDSELINELSNALVNLSFKYDELNKNITDPKELIRRDVECGQQLEEMRNRLIACTLA